MPLLMRWLLVALAIVGFTAFPAPAKAQEPLGCDQRLALAGYMPPVTPEVIFIGVRGSGESPKLVNGLGRRSVLLYRALQNDPKYRSRIVCTSALLGSYQAQSMPALNAPATQWKTFVNEMMGSADALATPLAAMAHKFPHARFIISGFSKGAAVAQLGVQKAIHEDPTIAARIDSLVSISSPLAPNGIVSLAQRIASTPLRLAALKTVIAALSNLHKVIPDQCVIAGCHSLKKMSQSLDKSQKSLVTTLDAVARSQRTISHTQQVPTVNVCQSGDIICAPLAAKALPSLSIHNNWYQDHQEWVRSWFR